MTDDFDPVTYAAVNNAWGDLKLPPITEKEAHKVFDKLLTKFGGRKMRGPWWAGRPNRAWASTKVLDTHYRPMRYSGLPAAVHDAGHWVNKRLHPHMKTHCAPHAALEKAMIEHVIAKGLHVPKRKRAKTKPTKAQRIAHAEGLLKRWMTKKRRAETAIKKLAAKRRRLERVIDLPATGI